MMCEIDPQEFLSDIPGNAKLLRKLLKIIKQENNWVKLRSYLQDELPDLLILAESNQSRYQMNSGIQDVLCHMWFQNLKVQEILTLLSTCGLESAMFLFKKPEPVEIVSEPTEKKVRSGEEEVIFTFKTRGFPTPSYQWYRCHDGNSTKLQMEISSDLTLRHPKISHSGQYYCESFQRHPKKEHILHTVTSRVVTLEVQPLSPSILQQPESQILEAGDVLTLRCIASADPEPEYQWYKDGRSLSNSNSNHLEIRKASETDTGVYHCRIWNNLSSLDSNDATVEVKTSQGIELLQELKVEIEGSSELVLICSARGRPPLRYHWYKNGEPFKETEDGLLRISQRMCDSWTYQCKIVNKEGHERLTAPVSHQVDPVIKKATAKIAILIGNGFYFYYEELSAPTNDVSVLGNQLEKMGFTPLAAVNLTYAEMKIFLQNLSTRIPEGADVIFYYAGHGFELNGCTYIIPVDARKVPRKDEYISVEEILSYVTKRKPRCVVSITDACRKIPHRDEHPLLFRGVKSNPRIDDGDCHVLLVYSTLPHYSAFERKDNGIYMGFLMKHIHKTDPIQQVFQDAHNDIYKQFPKMKPTLTQRRWASYSLYDGVEKSSDGRGFRSLCETPFMKSQNQCLQCDPSSPLNDLVEITAQRYELLCNEVQLKLRVLPAVTNVVSITPNVGFLVDNAKLIQLQKLRGPLQLLVVANIGVNKVSGVFYWQYPLEDLWK